MGEDTLNGLAEKLLYFLLCMCLVPLYIFIIGFGLAYRLKAEVKRDAIPPTFKNVGFLAS